MTDSPPEERLLTEAQREHLRRLYSSFEQAQRALNDFTSYLLTEHGIERPEEWQLAADLGRFVRVEAGSEAA